MGLTLPKSARMVFRVSRLSSESVLLAPQVHPVGPQREPEERGELRAVPQSAARVRAVSSGGRDAVSQPFTPRRD